MRISAFRSFSAFLNEWELIIHSKGNNQRSEHTYIQHTYIQQQQQTARVERYSPLEKKHNDENERTIEGCGTHTQRTLLSI